MDPLFWLCLCPWRVQPPDLGACHIFRAGLQPGDSAVTANNICKHLQTGCRTRDRTGRSLRAKIMQRGEERLSSPSRGILEEAPGVSLQHLGCPLTPAGHTGDPGTHPRQEQHPVRDRARVENAGTPSPCCTSPPLPIDGWFSELPLPVVGG